MLAFSTRHRVLVAFAGLLLLVLMTSNTALCNDNAIEAKVNTLLPQLTLKEKLELLGGTGFATRAIPRLDIPEIKMIDGPQGVRGPQATAFPTMMAMVATWNPALMRRVARGIGQEVRAIGRNMILGPCVTLYRVPQSGRNHECFGEDPFLNSELATAYVQGVHAAGAFTSTKHYILNNQEQERFTINMHIDERAARELELPAFEAAVHAGTDSIMASYNRIDGVYASESSPFLIDILKKEWDFKGIVVSDWGATHDTLLAAHAGLDLEMPTGDFFNPMLLGPLVNPDQITLTEIDDKVRRILRVALQESKIALKDDEIRPVLNSPENRQAALDAAREAVVLLKNDRSVLPLRSDKIRSIAVLGPNAASRRFHGGGSGEVRPLYFASALDGLRDRLGSKTTIRYAPGAKIPGQTELVEPRYLSSLTADGKTQAGLKAEFFNNPDLSGPAVATELVHEVQVFNTMSPHPRIELENFSIRYTGSLEVPTEGPLEFRFYGSSRAYRFFLDGKLVVDVWDMKGPEKERVRFDRLAAGPHDLRIEYRSVPSQGGSGIQFEWSYPELPARAALDEAVELARTSDVAIIVAGSSGRFETENEDRPDIEFPGNGIQERLIEAVAKVNPRTIVVLNSGAPIRVRGWRDQVPVILQAWFAGQESGLALADLLVGNANPSGKLPMTWPRDIKDSPSSAYYPGKKGQIDYSKASVFEGYRSYDARGIEPEFAFGHGLSYTQFSFSDLKVIASSQNVRDRQVVVRFKLKNTGKSAGAEVAQLYISPPSSASVMRPPRELKSFRKVFLKPGESQQIKWELDPRSFSYWDTQTHRWKVDTGRFGIHVGSSSRNLPLNTSVEFVQ